MFLYSRFLFRILWYNVGRKREAIMKNKILMIGISLLAPLIIAGLIFYNHYSGANKINNSSGSEIETEELYDLDDKYEYDADEEIIKEESKPIEVETDNVVSKTTTTSKKSSVSNNQTTTRSNSNNSSEQTTTTKQTTTTTKKNDDCSKPLVSYWVAEFSTESGCESEGNSSKWFGCQFWCQEVVSICGNRLGWMLEMHDGSSTTINWQKLKKDENFKCGMN